MDFLREFTHFCLVGPTHAHEEEEPLPLGLVCLSVQSNVDFSFDNRRPIWFSNKIINDIFISNKDHMSNFERSLLSAAAGGRLLFV